MRYVDAVLCTALVLLIEWLAVAAGAGDQLAGPFELARGLGSLVPLGVVLAAPIAIGGALWIVALAETSPRRGRLLVAIPAAALALGTAIGVSGGRLLAGARRPLFVLAVTALAFGAAWLLWRPAQRAQQAAQERRPALWVGAIALSVVGLEVLNRVVLVRLYPAFHVGLAVLTLWVAALAGAGWTIDWARRWRLGAAVAVGTLSVGLAVGAPGRLRFYDNIRFLVVERAPLLGLALKVASAVEPPPPLEVPGRSPMLGPRAVDLRRRDLVLITIDALRADHVGAMGYERPTTPQIDRLVAGGVTFTQAYTPTPHTSYAVTSLMTGKYMRPLLRQGVGEDSATFARVLRRYGYRTAAFYPPAVFFVDGEKFRAFADRGFDFEYRKEQFSSAAERVQEVEAYLEGDGGDAPLFLWVHLFEPHEPYAAHRADFGERAIDRYDAEIALADEAVGTLVERIRAKRPEAVVVVTADHGEEFGDHGGRYHGTTVYDEQVRVPLVVHAPGALEAREVSVPVSLVDLLPTMLRALDVPLSPRLRGQDLGPLMVGRGEEDDGFAFAETDSQTLLAEGDLRLVCARQVGACRLFDTSTDPAQEQDVASDHVAAFAAMKKRSAGFLATMGTFETGGDASRWPRALRRGIAGDAEAALDVAGLLDDVDVAIRRKAAETLFALRVAATAVHLRRALRDDDDDLVRNWAALTLTRLGEGAPRTLDLLEHQDVSWRRLAALALAEAGNDRGQGELLRWWRRAYPKEARDARETIPFERAREIAAALANIRSEDAVVPLGWALRDVRLRRYVAQALAEIGEEAARPALADALADERYQDARVALADALVGLGGKHELRDPLVRFLGVPDPIPNGLLLAARAELLPFIGGPRDRELARLREFAGSGVVVGMVVPDSDHATGAGFRIVVRARAFGTAGQVRVGLAERPMGDGDRKQRVPKRAPRLGEDVVTLAVPASDELGQLHGVVPEGMAKRLEPKEHRDFVVYATQSVELDSMVVVPLTREVPPPAPEPR